MKLVQYSAQETQGVSDKVIIFLNPMHVLGLTKVNNDTKITLINNDEFYVSEQIFSVANEINEVLK